MAMSDGAEKRALRSILQKYPSIFGLEPKQTWHTNRDLVLSPFELTGFLDKPMATHSGVKFDLRNQLSAFTDYSFTFGTGFCSSRSMWSQADKDRVRTRKCKVSLLQNDTVEYGYGMRVLFRMYTHPNYMLCFLIKILLSLVLSIVQF